MTPTTPSDSSANPDKAFPVLKLIQKIGRRAERGHLWVFSNEVEIVSGQPKAGDEVEILGPRDHFIGMGLFSQSSLIRARIYSRKRGEVCNQTLINQRFEQAIAYRREVFASETLPESYRLIHSESDGLPGLIVDVYGDRIVLQISTAAMDMRRDFIVSALTNLLHPAAIIERGDIPFRSLEGLPSKKEVICGEAPQPSQVKENGITLLADLMEGQKTGYFLDQAQNRAASIPFFAGKKVLDLFSYVGSWTILAAANGAASSLGIDSSQQAIDLATQARDMNGLDAAKCSFRDADAFEFLRDQAARAERYDLIVLDPPALSKSKRDLEGALRAYRELNLRAMRILSPGGILITCSCSHAVSDDDFKMMLLMAAKDSHSDFTILRQGGQSPDHPEHLSTPETRYLKCIFLKKKEF